MQVEPEDRGPTLGGEISTVSHAGGLCHLRDVLPEVLRRYALSIRADDAELFVPFAESAASVPVAAVTC
jgi:hypothetical protein